MARDLRLDGPGGIGRGPMESRVCDARGCLLATRKKKPYCPKHLPLMPYAQWVMAGEDRRLYEDARAARGEAWPDDAHAKDIVTYLSEAPFATAASLAQGLHIDPDACAGYLDALLAAGDIERSGALYMLPLSQLEEAP